MDNRRWKQVPRRFPDEPSHVNTPVDLSPEFLFRLASQIEDRLARSAQKELVTLGRLRSRSRYIE